MVRFPIQVDFVQNDDDPVDVAFIVRFDTATASATAELASRIPTYWSDRSSSRAAVVHSVLDSAGLLVVGKPEVVELGDGSGLVALADRLMQTNQSVGLERGLDVALAVDRDLFSQTSGRRLVIFIVSDIEYEGFTMADSFVHDLSATRLPSPIVTAVVDRRSCGAAEEADWSYQRVALELDGSVESLCSTDWDLVTQRLGVQATGQRTTFALAPGPPEDESIRLKVDGQTRTDWDYDAATWSINFAEAPPPGSAVHVEYSIVVRPP